MDWIAVGVAFALVITLTGLIGLGARYRYMAITKSVLWTPPRRLTRLAKSAAVLLVVVVGVSAGLANAQSSSRLPDRMNMMAGTADYGGGKQNDHHISHHGSGTVSVEKLTGPLTGEPDRRFTLTAEKKTIRLNSGITMEAWTFNGQTPGPELRMRKGELVEVTLINKDIADGVTLHWHGLDVPNAEDGVAGATQNAVMPGQTHTYRFRVEQTGTYWYHSHQNSAEAVKKGLFGALIVEDPENTPAGKDITVMTHMWEDDSMTFGITAKIEQVQTAPGTPVRLRLINTDNWLQRKFAVVGVPFKVAAIDGTELNGPRT